MATADEYRSDAATRAGIREYLATLNHVSNAGQRRDIQITCYQHAVMMCDFELLESVLETDIPLDANCLGYGASAITIAAGGGSARMVRFLLERGARVNTESWEGQTPLEFAIGSGNLEIVGLLLDRGADPSYRAYRGTPLEIATSTGFGAIAELLRVEGARDIALREEAELAGFPSFSLLFEEHPRFKHPLAQVVEHFGYIDVTLAVLNAMRAAIARSVDATAEVVALLAHYNWRYQLLGAFAALLLDNYDPLIQALWDAFDSGSVISPHLAVAAQRCDPEFEMNARIRLESGCPIRTNRFAALDWYKRSDAARPASLDDASSRATAALIDICQQLTESETWLATVLADNSTARHREKSSALSWQQRINAILGEAGYFPGARGGAAES